MSIDFRAGACFDVFGAEPDASFDAFVSDWPAGVAFMSRTWDRDHGGRDAWIKVWAENAAMMRRKAKPGAFSLTWALPRTAHWTATALEDGGWFVQDVIVHVFGQGWPKGKTALKPASEHWILARNGSGGALQIDAARVARGVEYTEATFDTGTRSMWGGGKRLDVPGNALGSWPPNFVLSHCPECEERGTRRVKGSNAPGRGSNGTGERAIGFGVAPGKPAAMPHHTDPDAYGMEDVPAFDCAAACDCGLSVLAPAGGEPPRCACGRAMWWACPVAQMDAQSGERASGIAVTRNGGGGIFFGGINPGAKGFAAPVPDSGYTDSGGASRFFPRFTYQAKAAGGERHAGCDDFYWRADKRRPFGFVRVIRDEWEALPDAQGTCPPEPQRPGEGGMGRALEARGGAVRARGNVHPTVKSVALMEWLVSLVCPPGGRVGDIAAGSGGTGIAVHRLNERGLGASFLGADICPEAIEIAEARIAWWRAVRLDVEPVKPRAATAQEDRQRTIFDAIEGRR